MSIKQHTPCDDDGFVCPYNAQNWGDCEYWCGSNPESDEDDFHYDEEENN